MTVKIMQSKYFLVALWPVDSGYMKGELVLAVNGT